MSMVGNQLESPCRYFSERSCLCEWDIMVAGNSRAKFTGTMIREQLHRAVEKFMMLTTNVSGGFFMV